MIYRNMSADRKMQVSNLFLSSSDETIQGMSNKLNEWPFDGGYNVDYELLSKLYGLIKENEAD